MIEANISSKIDPRDSVLNSSIAQCQQLFREFLALIDHASDIRRGRICFVLGGIILENTCENNGV